MSHMRSVFSCLEATQCCLDCQGCIAWHALQRLAERAAWLVEVEYLDDSSLGTPILSIADAIKAESFYGAHPEPVRSGNAAKALAEAKNVIRGARWAADYLELRCTTMQTAASWGWRGGLGSQLI